MVTATRATLVYDSARADAHTGARSGIASDRSLLYRVGEYVIDLLVQSGHGDVSIVQGQLLGSSGREAISGATVVATGAAKAVTDDLGEFALLLRRGASALLSIETADSALVCSVPDERVN